MKNGHFNFNDIMYYYNKAYSKHLSKTKWTGLSSSENVYFDWQLNTLKYSLLSDQFYIYLKNLKSLKMQS